MRAQRGLQCAAVPNQAQISNPVLVIAQLKAILLDIYQSWLESKKSIVDMVMSTVLSKQRVVELTLLEALAPLTTLALLLVRPALTLLLALLHEVLPHAVHVPLIHL